MTDMLRLLTRQALQLARCDPDPSVRAAAREALQQLGQLSRPVELSPERNGWHPMFDGNELRVELNTSFQFLS